MNKKQSIPKVSSFETHVDNPTSGSKVDFDKLTGVHNNVFDALQNFRIPTIKMFNYVISNYDPDTKEVKINASECAKEFNYSSPVSIYQGVAQLLDHKILFRKTGHNSTYFVNAKYIVNE